MAGKVITNFIAKALFKQKGAIANNKAVNFSANALEQRLKNVGVDPNAIKSEQELNQILSFVKQAEDQAFNQRFGDMLGGSKFDKPADVLDMTGKKIDPRSKIMGGQQSETEAEILARINKENKKGIAGIKNRQLTKDEYQDFLDEIGGADQLEAYNFDGTVGDAKRIVKEQKDYMSQMEMEYKKGKLDPVAGDKSQARKKFLEKKLEEMEASGDKRLMTPDEIEELSTFDPEDMAQGGRAGFAAGSAGSLLLRLTKGFMQATGRKPNPDEINKIIQETAERQVKSMQSGLSDDKILSMGDSSINVVKREMQNIIKNEKPDMLKLIDELDKPFVDNEGRFFNSNGGRIGLKAGMTKRAFLKLMGGVGAGIAGLKSGLLGFGKGAGKQVAKEVVKKSTTTPPPYFFELANKIKILGKPDKVTYADRVEIHRYTGKNGDEYELIEDLSTGDMRIQKDKTGVGSYNDKTFDTIEDRTVLEYKKGDADVDPETGTAFKSADEYEEYKVEFDADGTAADSTDLDAVVQKEIIEEAGGEAPSIKKAGGGIARMLGE